MCDLPVLDLADTETTANKMAYNDLKDVASRTESDDMALRKRDSKTRASFAAINAGDDKAIEGQLYSMNDIDPALDAKMRLVNDVQGFLSYRELS